MVINKAAAALLMKYCNEVQGFLFLESLRI